MKTDPTIENSQEHADIFALIPWYLNSTIGEPDRQKVEAHLRTCAVCRDELRHEREVFTRMNAEAGVEYLAAPSLKRLQAMLDSTESGNTRSSVPPTRTTAPRRFAPRWMAASVAAVAVAAVVLAANRWTHSRSQALEGEYYTLSTPAAQHPGEVIRAVFSPNLTLVELQAILDKSHLRIVSGPTEAGVYSLAATSNLPVNSSLAILRRDAGVRFAESTQPPP